MKIEFIIPTYKRKTNLMGTLNSIILQSRSNWLVNVIIDNNEDNYEGIVLPDTIEGIMELFQNNPVFNFYKSLDIDNINAEILV